MSAGEMWRRIVHLIRRRSAAEELDEEMRLHVALRAEKLREAGVEILGKRA